MHITERFLAFTLLGAEWVLWLLIALSVISFAVMIERAWYYATHRIDVMTLAEELRRLLAQGHVAEARSRAVGGDTVEHAAGRAAPAGGRRLRAADGAATL